MLTGKDFAALRTQRLGRGNSTTVVGDTFTTTVAVSPTTSIAEWQNLGSTVFRVLGDGRLQLAVQSAPSALSSGQLWVDADQNSLAHYNGTVTVHLGQESVVYVRNNSGSTIPGGRAVYLSGSLGSQPLVVLASNATYSQSQTIGLMSVGTANNAQSYVVTSGLCHGIDTSAFIDGDVLWLGTAGTVVNVRPSDPTRQIRVGYCVRAHSTQGKILVAVQVMDTLDGLSDVTVTAATTGEFVRFNGTSWVNTLLTVADIPSLSAVYQPLDSDLTSIAALATTAFGRGLLTEASSTTTKTTLGLVAVASSGSASDITTGTLADGRLSSNVALKNINNSFSTDQSITGTTLSPLNVVTGIASYGEIAIKNTNTAGTADHVATANTGTASTLYIDMGINNSAWPAWASTVQWGGPIDSYLYSDGGHLIIGTQSAKNIYFCVNGGQVSTIAYTINSDRTGTFAATQTFTSGLTLTPAASTSGTPVWVTATGPAHTGLTTAEVIDINLALNRTVTFGNTGGTLAAQRAVVFQAPAYAAGVATTITAAATLAIAGPPTAGTNVTLTNSYALWVQSGNVNILTGNLVLGAGAITGNGSGLTSLNASNLSSGTVADARLSANIPVMASSVLPAVSGLNLTNLNASNLASGTIAAARMPALTGDVTSTVNTVATTIAAGVVTLAKMANLAANSFIGNNTGSAAVPLALTVAQAKTLLAITTSDVSGCHTGTGAANQIATWSGATALAGSANFTYDGITFVVGQTAQSSGVAGLLTLTGAAHTARTLSTEATDININLARTVQWATGALATQRFIRIQAPTISAVAASTVTNTATVAISGAPIAGTNATLTNTYALWIQSGRAQLDGGLTVTGAATNTITQSVATTGSPTGLTFTGGAHTTLTASVEADDVDFVLNRTVQFATGALTTQRAFVVRAPTYAFVAASTITNAATVAVTGAPAAGTNATITNAYALWIQAGRTQLDGNCSIGATGSAVGFMGAAPVVRPSMAAATGTTTRTTFDTTTVTLPQLAERVKALIDDLRAYGLEA